MLTEELRRKRVDGAKALLKVREVQSHIGFRDIITGNENSAFVNINPSWIWIGAEETVAIRPKLRKRHAHHVLRHRRGCSYQLAPARPFIQQNLLQSRSYYCACNHALNRKTAKWDTIHITPRERWQADNSKSNMEQMTQLGFRRAIHLIKARISYDPTFASSVGSMANSRDSLSLRWRIFASHQRHFGESDNRHSQISFSRPDRAIEANSWYQ
jgi:hypothetical protein